MFSFCEELIVTQWDVKINEPWRKDFIDEELIVTQWDVKARADFLEGTTAAELIVTQWDVKTQTKGNIGNMSAN